jgi:peptide/nickel transport system ATP-binding protein
LADPTDSPPSPEPTDAPAAGDREIILSVKNLVTGFDTDTGLLRAVDDVSFDLRSGQTLGVVGESGSGKSVTSLSILGLLPAPQGRVISGQILYRGRDLVGLREREMRSIRGAKIAMIFQEPMTSLNPVYTVGAQIIEAIRLHRPVSRAAARARAVELLRLVGIPDPGSRVDTYPHQLSGGMRQRVMIAMALSCEPDILIADEPTTALDVTIQAQILDLIKRLQGSLGMSVVLITHDLGIVAQHVDSVVVLYAGRVVESATVGELFANTRNPYTRGLLRSIPPMGTSRGERPRRLPTIEGVVPSLQNLPPGCRFQARCELRRPECEANEPALREIGPGHLSRCHFAEEMTQ